MEKTPIIGTHEYGEDGEIVGIKATWSGTPGGRWWLPRHGVIDHDFAESADRRFFRRYGPVAIVLGVPVLLGPKDWLWTPCWSIGAAPFWVAAWATRLDSPLVLIVRWLYFLGVIEPDDESHEIRHWWNDLNWSADPRTWFERRAVRTQGQS